MKPGPYGPFPYSPIIRRPRLEWPGGAHVALWVVPNIEFFSLETRPGGLGPGKIPDIPIWAMRDYGNRVGVFRLMEVLDRYGIRATVALNSDICVHHPEIIEEGEKRRWEWMGHNQSNSRRLNEVPAEEEPKIIRDTLDTIARASGKRPVGWLGAGLQETWNTLDLLAEAGCEYVADWGPNDDQPYTMTVAGDKTIVSLPYSYNINDKQAFESANMTPADFQDAICRQFDTLYREGATSGRVMHIAVHPYLTGMPYRIGALDAALKYICKHKKVWKATGSEIARHYRAQLEGRRANGKEIGAGRNRPRSAGERLTMQCRGRLSSMGRMEWTRRMIMRMMRTFGRAALGFAVATLISVAPVRAAGYRHHRHGRVAFGQSLAAVHRDRQGLLHRREHQDRSGLRPGERGRDPAARGRLAGHDVVHRDRWIRSAPSSRAPRLAIARFEMQAPPYALMAKSSIKSLKDLKGKVISVGGPKDITRIYVDRMLAPHGLKTGDYDYVYAGATTARAQALLSGAVDAAILLPPSNFQIQSRGFNDLGLTIEYAPELAFSGTMVNKAWAARNPDVLKRVLAAQSKSIEYLLRRAQPRRGGAHSGRVSRQKVDDVEKAYDFFRKNNFFDRTGKISRRKLNAIVDALVGLGDLPARGNIERFLLPGVAQLSD